MPVPALLAALALAAPPTSPLQGCAAQRSDVGWVYKCRGSGLVAMVQDRAGESISDHGAVMDGVVDGLVQSYGGEARKLREQWTLGGERVNVLRAELADEGTTMFVTALARPKGTRLLMCVSKRDGCDAVLAHLAASPWRSGAAPGADVQEEAASGLGGREVKVPEGCTRETQGDGGARISCPPMYFAMWSGAPAGLVGGLLDKLNEMSIAKLQDEDLPFERDTTPCRVAGAATTCRRVRVAPDDRAASVVMLSAAVKLDGRTYMVACLAKRADAAPCSAVFEVGEER